MTKKTSKTSPFKEDLPDIQKTSGNHKPIPIDKVGVKDVKMPFNISQKSGGLQYTVGKFSLFVNLPANVKGTHMSRFIVELQRHLNLTINKESLEDLCKRISNKLNSATSFISVEFDYFLNKFAPISKLGGFVDYKCRFDMTYNEKKKRQQKEFWITVNVPITSLCPCSKEISDNGAHNQRSNVTVTAMYNYNQPNTLWLEDLIEIVEKSGSCDIYSVLKRPDEKYVTEYAYDNPVFCEDIVRNVADKLSANPAVSKYRIKVENHESIHNHIAYAFISR